MKKDGPKISHYTQRGKKFMEEINMDVAGPVADVFIDVEDFSSYNSD